MPTYYFGVVDIDVGDPTVREWFLVKSQFWPTFLSLFYIVFSKWLGIWLMKDRKPFDLRIPMILYNAFLVVSYVSLLCMTFYYLPQLDRKLLCHAGVLKDLESDVPMKLVTCAWLCYLLKYIEYFDTVFFVLRKKNHLLTNLHIMHHTMIPFGGWMGLRTERSGFNAFPVIINGLVHVLMYTYYGLAALGPSVQKYLWWKKYLTIIQMAQFVIIFFFIIVVLPLTGCHRVKLNCYVGGAAAILLFALFYNYYYQSFIHKKKSKQGNPKLKVDNEESSNSAIKKEE